MRMNDIHFELLRYIIENGRIQIPESKIKEEFRDRGSWSLSLKELVQAGLVDIIAQGKHFKYYSITVSGLRNFESEGGED